MRGIFIYKTPGAQRANPTAARPTSSEKRRGGKFPAFSNVGFDDGDTRLSDIKLNTRFPPLLLSHSIHQLLVLARPLVQ